MEPTVHHQLDSRASSLMVLLCFIWASAQIILKYTAVDMVPVLQIAIRSAGGALLTACFVWARGQRLFNLPGAWKPGIVVGFLFASEFYLVGESLRYTSASHTTIFLYSAPIFAALGLNFFTPGERLSPLQWVGVVLAFIGIVISFMGADSSQNTTHSPNIVLGDGLALLAGALWGATTVVVRSSQLKYALATETLFYQLVGAAVLLWVGSLFMGYGAIHWSRSLLWGLAAQIVLVSFVSFLVWFWLLRHYLASRLGVLSFMTPLFGVILGVLLLGERLEQNFIVGAVCVILGIILVNGHDKLSRLKGSKRSAS